MHCSLPSSLLRCSAPAKWPKFRLAESPVPVLLVLKVLQVPLLGRVRCHQGHVGLRRVGMVYYVNPFSPVMVPPRRRYRDTIQRQPSLAVSRAVVVPLLWAVG